MRRTRTALNRRRPKAKARPKARIIDRPLLVRPKTSKRKRWDAILDRLPGDREIIGVEIGVLNGNTAMRILKERPLLKHYMVDPWISPEEGSSYRKSGDDNALKPAAAHEGAFQKTKTRVAFAGKRGIIMRMFSKEAVKSFEDKSVDFVFIDGDHSYEGVSEDIQMWKSKIKPGGWIGGHDYNHPRLPGVKKAVDEVANQDEIELDDNRTWFVRVK